MTDKAIDYNIGKLKYFLNDNSIIKDRQNSPEWLLSTYTRIMDYHGAPARGWGMIYLETDDFWELERSIPGGIMRSVDLTPSDEVKKAIPNHESYAIRFIEIMVYGYHMTIYHVRSLPSQILELQSLNTVNQ